MQRGRAGPTGSSRKHLGIARIGLLAPRGMRRYGYSVGLQSPPVGCSYGPAGQPFPDLFEREARARGGGVRFARQVEDQARGRQTAARRLFFHTFDQSPKIAFGDRLPDQGEEFAAAERITGRTAGTAARAPHELAVAAAKKRSRFFTGHVSSLAVCRRISPVGTWQIARPTAHCGIVGDRVVARRHAAVSSRGSTWSTSSPQFHA